MHMIYVEQSVSYPSQMHFEGDDSNFLVSSKEDIKKHSLETWAKARTSQDMDGALHTDFAKS